jgi:hypothetical protein
LDFFYPVKYCSAVRSADLTGQVLPPVFNWVNPLESIYLPLKTPQLLIISERFDSLCKMGYISPNYIIYGVW